VAVIHRRMTGGRVSSGGRWNWRDRRRKTWMLDVAECDEVGAASED
jgi:hypothetical protein